MATVYLLKAGAGRTRPSTAAWGQGTLKEAVFCSALSVGLGRGTKNAASGGTKTGASFPGLSLTERGRQSANVLSLPGVGNHFMSALSDIKTRAL